MYCSAGGQAEVRDQDLKQIREDMKRKEAEIEKLQKEMENIRRDMGESSPKAP